MELSVQDKKRIKLELKISTIIPIILFILIIILLSIGIGIFGFFFKMESGFLTRGLTILFLIFIPFLHFFLLSLKKYIDLKRNLKIKKQLDVYKIKKVKTDFFIVSEKLNFKIKIFEDLIPLIDTNTPINIEYTELSKILLFVSNDNQNLLDKIEKI